MAFLLRKITKPKWYPDPALTWLAQGEVPADALSDLRTDRNELSVWSVDQQRANLDPIITALAAKLQKVEKVDYALFDDAVLPTIAIVTVKSEGDSPHATANANWHQDLIELTATKVTNLAGQLMTVDHVRVPRDRVKHLLLEALDTGAIPRDGIDEGLLNELEPPAKPLTVPAPLGTPTAAAPQERKAPDPNSGLRKALGHVVVWVTRFVRRVR